MKKDNLQKRLIDLSHNTERNEVTPLIMEYAELYSTCLRFTGCDKSNASNYAITYLENKYRPKPKVEVLDLDDVCLVNCNIQRYR